MKGTKRKRSEGVWEIRVYIGRDPVTGKPKQVSKTVRGGSREADDALRDLIQKQAPSRTDGVGSTFGQLLDRWLVECDRMDLSPTTMRTYRAQVEQTIRPRLGKVPLNRLTAKHLDDLYGALKMAGRSPKTIRNHHAIVSSALHQGVRWGWVRSNVADMAKPPRISQRRVNVPSVDIVRTVIAAAEERDPRLAPLLMVAALTGMRRGELCALRWSDVHLDTGELHVSRSVVVVPGGVAEKTTKTDRERRVALDEVGVAVLVAHRRRMDGWARQADASIRDDAFVFSPEIDASKPFRPDNVTSFFIRVRDSLGVNGLRLAAPSVDVVRSVIAAAEEQDPRLAPLLRLASLVGMRPGQLCGLRWSDIDSDAAQLGVTSSSGVALDGVGVAMLRTHRHQVDQWATQADVALRSDAFVFSPEPDGSQPFSSDGVTSFFIRIRDQLGLSGIRLHDLRHFTATQLIGAGVDVRTVAGRLGHSDPSLTLRVYSHVIEERDRAAAAIMGQVLAPAPSDPNAPETDAPTTPPRLALAP